jgi:uncharacterized protein YndB with AHSA1/START domain
MGKPLVLTVSRHFDAPPEMVFDAWLNPEAARHFLFATDAGLMQKVEIDARIGGKFVIVEKRGDAKAEHLGEYMEIDRPHRLVFSFAATRSEGLTRVQLDFKAEGKGCLLTLTHDMDPQWAEYEAQTRQGWTTILGREAQALVRVIGTVMRRFAMPRAALWAAWTESARLAKWWGPRGFAAPVCSIDPKPGGALLIEMQAPNGMRNTMRGLVEEAVANERLAYAVNLIDASGTLLAKSHTTVTFADAGEGTELTVVHDVVPYIEMGPDLLADMTRGLNESLDRLTA